MDLIGVKVHDVKAIMASMPSMGVSKDYIMQASHWKLQNTFSKFCLKDLAGQDQKKGSYHLGAFIATQQEISPSEQFTLKKKDGGTMPGTTSKGSVRIL